MPDDAPSPRPYPTGWERHERLPDGSGVFVRPLKPEDAALYPDFLREVSAEDLRLRFFAPLRELSPALIERLTHLDYARAVAFIALDETSGRMLGVARLHYDVDGVGGEYAILLQSRLKGHGLGRLLMQRLMHYARADGLKRIHGQVLVENCTMLELCAELGFVIEDDPAEAGVKRVTFDLDPDPPASSG
jgi:GNAT superfamily N-acetyltransferase